MCAPALRPARLLGCMASPRLLGIASAACFGVPLGLACVPQLHASPRCWCAYSGHLLLGAPTQRAKRIYLAIEAHGQPCRQATGSRLPLNRPWPDGAAFNFCFNKSWPFRTGPWLALGHQAGLRSASPLAAWVTPVRPLCTADSLWLDWATIQFRFLRPSSFNTALQLVLRPPFLVHFV
jgi:hypothetical protein